MSKFVAFQTYEVFRSAYENNTINNHALNFIVDTGQLYTHGIFLNSVSFGATSGVLSIPLTIAGGNPVELSLATHTHSNYLLKNSNIDIGSYKIVSGNTDLLFLDNGSVSIGKSGVATYIKGPAYRGSYTILDTGNFSIKNETLNGTVIDNVALFTYGSTKFLLDYVKRMNTNTIFDNLVSYTCLGTTNVDSKLYGFITFYTADGSLNSPWGLLRFNITNKSLEYRTSASTTWSSLSSPTIPTNAINTAGIVSAPTSSNGNKVWKTDADGNPAWRNEKTVSFSNLLFLQTSGTNLMTYNSQAVRTVLAGTNITFSHSNNILTISSTCDKDSRYTSTLTSVNLTTSWTDVDALNSKLTAGNGSYLILITYASCIYTGVFSYVQGGAVDDEIILHCSGTIDSVGGVNRGTLFAKIGTTSQTTYLRLATSLSESNASLSIKYRKLI